MTRRRLVDTNLIVRYLVQDHARHAQAAGALFAACARRELEIVLLPEVLAECVFVLESFYEHPRREIASALATLISSPGIAIERAEIHLDALERYAKTKLHFVDSTLAATASAGRIPVASFDHDFRSFPDVRVELE